MVRLYNEWGFQSISAGQDIYYKSVNEIEVEGLEIQIYPNLTSHVAVLSMPKSGIYGVAILDMNGRLVGRYSNVDVNKLTLDVRNFEKGMYYVRVSEDGQLVGKLTFIVE